MRAFYVLALCGCISAWTFAQQPSTTTPPGAALGAPRPTPTGSAGGNAASMPLGTAPARTDLVSFDPLQAQLRWRQGRWEIEAGNQRLMDFGVRERDACDALNVIRQLHLTQRGVVGHPVPIMEYWLADGQAPRGLGANLRLVTIDRTTLRAESVQGQWCVLDRHRVLFNFGPMEADARQALATIQNYGFDHIGYVGTTQPAMIYFVNCHNGLGGGASLDPKQSMIAPAPGDQSALKQETAQNNLAPGGRESALNKQMLQQVQLAGRGVQQLAPPALGGVTQLRFDARDLLLRQEGGAWKLYGGRYVLADFGAQAHEAQKALKLLKDYGCNEECLVGLPAPTFSYFLANGHAPLGLHTDLPGRDFQTDHINVRMHENSWYVCDQNKPLLYFGDRKQEAQQVADAIKRYRFDFVGQLGGPGQPALSILVRRR